METLLTRIEDLAKICAPEQYSWSESGKHDARLRAIAVLEYLEGQSESLTHIKARIQAERASRQAPLTLRQAPLE